LGLFRLARFLLSFGYARQCALYRLVEGAAALQLPNHGTDHRRIGFDRAGFRLGRVSGHQRATEQPTAEEISLCGLAHVSPSLYGCALPEDQI
jgi:hypothetical protein